MILDKNKFKGLLNLLQQLFIDYKIDFWKTAFLRFSFLHCFLENVIVYFLIQHQYFWNELWKH